MTANSDGRVVAVTGANRGLGAAIARELACRGFAVACLTRSGTTPAVDEDFPQDARARLRAFSCDVTDQESIRAAIAGADALGQGLFGIVNNAGTAKGGASDSFSLADFEDVLRTNVLGVFAVCQAAYPYLLERGSGLIVNIGSFWDRIGGKAYAAYCASKAAVGAVSRSLAVEWAKKGIRVLDVAPGYVETDMTAAHLQRGALQAHLQQRIPRGYVGQPEEIARLIGALFAEDIAYLTGTTIYVDGGQGIAP